MFRMRPEVNDSTRGHLSRADVQLPDSPHAGASRATGTSRATLDPVSIGPETQRRQ